MPERFEQYLDSLDLPTRFRNRAEGVLSFFRTICPEDITDIFVCDLIKEDGSRAYESLWLFSASYVMEARDFIDRDRWDMIGLAGRVVGWIMVKKDYDVGEATAASRLNLEFRTVDSVSGDLKASGGNCDHLVDILRMYIVPNVAVRHPSRDRG